MPRKSSSKPEPLSPDWLAELFIGARLDELTPQERLIAKELALRGLIHTDATHTFRLGSHPDSAVRDRISRRHLRW